LTAASAPSPARTRSRRKLILAIVAIVIIAILVVPIILGGGVTVPVSKMTFNETTGSISYANVQTTTQTMTVFEYYFSLRTGGMVRTSDTDVATSRGTANITISMMLTNPSNQTIDLGKTTITGGIGTRTHTLYLSVDQGVRASGIYKLNVTITANVKPVLLPLEVGLTTSFVSTWQVS